MVPEACLCCFLCKDAVAPPAWWRAGSRSSPQVSGGLIWRWSLGWQSPTAVAGQSDTQEATAAERGRSCGLSHKTPGFSPRLHPKDLIAAHGPGSKPHHCTKLSLSAPFRQDGGTERPRGLGRELMSQNSKLTGSEHACARPSRSRPLGAAPRRWEPTGSPDFRLHPTCSSVALTHSRSQG